MSDLRLDQQLPVGGADTRSLGWWAMVMVVVTEGALFCYILFSYFYLWIQPQPNGTFPEGGAPSFTYSAPETIALVLSSIAVFWAQTGLARYRTWRVASGLGLAALLGIAYLALEFSEWANESFTLASSAYSSTFFVTTGADAAHAIVGVLILLALCLWAAMGYFDSRRHEAIHIGALFWHFVVAVWLAIFVSFYVAPQNW